MVIEIKSNNYIIISEDNTAQSVDKDNSKRIHWSEIKSISIFAVCLTSELNGPFRSKS
jgi:hypothetical protein